MKTNLYSIQDVLVGFHAPFIAPNDAAAKRDYRLWAQNQKNAADLRLFKLGTYEDSTGDIDSLVECLEGGIEYVGENQI